MRTGTGTDQIWAREEEKHKTQRTQVWHYSPLPNGASRTVHHPTGRGGGRSRGLTGHGDRTGQKASRAAPVLGHGGSGDSGGHGGAGSLGRPWRSGELGQPWRVRGLGRPWRVRGLGRPWRIRGLRRPWWIGELGCPWWIRGLRRPWRSGGLGWPWWIRGLGRPWRVRGLGRPWRIGELGRPWRVVPPKNFLGETLHPRGELRRRRRWGALWRPCR